MSESQVVIGIPGRWEDRSALVKAVGTFSLLTFLSTVRILLVSQGN
ncbi:hypothetical protein [Baia soyae]|uniref:Uncharacterized protein n=1 Tax=Baia soyae TaxID=1544746 RepID=A0A4R2RZV8_9BACL|nr:hypothetical protein [Baia soyae]TCP65561.1 hypothetical protein EDD57_13244 [Baia soyae]